MSKKPLLEKHDHLWIQTATGIKFNLINPAPGSIVLEDIAAALGKICRYNGHTFAFYSVAEHSVLMARQLREEGHEPMVQFWALMHDAVEAYVCDMPSPVKTCLNELSQEYLGGYGTYKQLYQELEVRLCIEFGLVVDDQTEATVRLADLRMLATERQQVVPVMIEDISDVEWGIPEGIEPYPDLYLECWNPSFAENRFEREYKKIKALLEEG